jgi:hypothetical protein
MASSWSWCGCRRTVLVVLANNLLGRSLDNHVRLRQFG